MDYKATYRSGSNQELMYKGRSFHGKLDCSVPGVHNSQPEEKRMNRVNSSVTKSYSHGAKLLIKCYFVKRL